MKMTRKTWTVFCAAVLTGALSAHADEGAGAKPELPAMQAISAATKTAQDSYKDAIAAAKTRQAKLDLVRQMIVALPGEVANPENQYAITCVARLLAHEVVDVQGTMVLADAQNEYFKTDVLKLKCDELLLLSKAAKDWDDRKDILRACDIVIAAAIREDRYDLAKPLTEVFSGTAKALGSFPFTQEVNDRLAQLRDCESAYASVKKSIDTLRAKPTDADACTEVGRYTCMFKGDWALGLPMLVSGSDEKLKSLAEKDLAAKSDEEVLAVADGWFELWGQQTGTAKEMCRRHTHALYNKVVPGLTGPARDKAISRRLALLPADPEVPEGPLEEQAGNDFRKLAMTLPALPSSPPAEDRWDGRIKYHTTSSLGMGGLIVYGGSPPGENPDTAPKDQTYTAYFYDSHDHMRLIVVHALGKRPFVSDIFVHSVDGPIVRVTNTPTNYFIRYHCGKPLLRTEFVKGQLDPTKTKFFGEDEAIASTGIEATPPPIAVDASGARVIPPKAPHTRILDTAFSSAATSPVAWPPRVVVPVVAAPPPVPTVAAPAFVSQIPAPAPAPPASQPAPAPVVETPPPAPTTQAAVAPPPPAPTTAPDIAVAPPSPAPTTAPAVAPPPIAEAPRAPAPAKTATAAPVVRASPPPFVAPPAPPKPAKPLPPALPMPKAIAEAQRLESEGRFSEALSILRRSATITPLGDRPVDFDDTCRRLEGKASAEAVKPYMQAPEDMRQ